MDGQDRDIWQGSYKIPWNEGAFSRRMLREHLSQEHDLASRRTEWIDRQAGFIDGQFLKGEPARILDLGCGPGFYSHRLARRGHRCYGIDFGPASIEYARAHNPAPLLCDFVLGDIRCVPLGGPYRLVMILYGEFNVFSPCEARGLLGAIASCLDAEGRLILEMQTPQGIEKVGKGETTQEHYEAGLFSDRPHICLTENRWIAEQGVAIQTFHITEGETGLTETYRSTSKAWTDEEFSELLGGAGFGDIGRCFEWPCNTAGLELWTARKQ